MKKALSLLLIVLVPLAALGQTPQPPEASPEQAIPLPSDHPASISPDVQGSTSVPIDPKWRKKLVEVRLQDGRVLQGKLVGLTPDTLSLEVQDFDFNTGKRIKRVETIPRAEILAVQRLQTHRRNPWVAVGLAVLILAVPMVVLATADD